MPRGAAKFSEFLTRKKHIDEKLRSVGWNVVSFDRKKSLSEQNNCAIENHPTTNDPADYALCVDGRIIGIVEAKKRKSMKNRLLTLLLVTVVQLVPALGREAADLSRETGAGAVIAQHVHRLEERIDELEALVFSLRDQVVATRALLSAANSSPARTSSLEPAAAEFDPPTLKPAGTVARSSQQDSSTIRVYWKEGLRLDSPNEEFKFRIGGRIQADFASFSANSGLEGDVGALRDGVEFRGARLGVQGTIHNNIDYKAEYDFTGDVLDGLNEGASFKDVYVGIRNIPVLGAIRIGHQKEPFSMEGLTSSRFTMFQERSSGTAFIPARNTGIVIRNQPLNKRISLAAGLFKTSADKGTAIGDGGFNFTTRFAGTPMFEDGGRKLVHLGIAYSRQNSFFGLLRFRERPEAHLAPRFVNTGVFRARKYQLVGIEGAFVAGPFSTQGEYIHNWVDATASGNPRFKSGYVQGSFFLTGENRRYSQDKAVFDRPRPAKNFFNGTGGFGAWEVAARYSKLDLNDAFVAGGEMNNFTLGLNWYLNPNTRWMFNYVLSDVKDLDNANIFQLRFSVDF